MKRQKYFRNVGGFIREKVTVRYLYIEIKFIFNRSCLQTKTHIVYLDMLLNLKRRTCDCFMKQRITKPAYQNNAK